MLPILTLNIFFFGRFPVPIPLLAHFLLACDGMLPGILEELVFRGYAFRRLPEAHPRLVEDQPLTFLFEEGEIHDQQTGSTWNMAGKAVAGDLAGSQLEPLATRSSFWFSLVAAFPDLELN